MAKRKRPRHAERRAKDPGWSSLEAAFFAAAPPDLPVPVQAAECFDDMGACAPRHGTLALSGLSRSVLAIGLPSLVLLVALSAAVFAR
jgi:hypothetical protein